MTRSIASFVLSNRWKGTDSQHWDMCQAYALLVHPVEREKVVLPSAMEGPAKQFGSWGRLFMEEKDKHTRTIVVRANGVLCNRRKVFGHG